MTAPDKLYIPIIEEDGKKLLCTNWWETDTSSRNAYVKETIPYIREDALIEWASNMLGQVSDMGFDDGDVEHGYTRALQDVIDKINSL